ncbi:MAG: dihydropteroate synthase [Verrucomicrobiota bacterium]|nr:dihydropteroate synthase [Verrucomicrobiota bacterium]
MRLLARGRVIEFPRRPLIMGIVNVSPDSFSGDGLSRVEAALALARQMEIDGAEIIDLGAESARTDRGPIPEREEIDRLGAFIEQWRGEGLLSINTWRPAVARAALALGGHLLNDIGALPTDENARTCAETGAGLVIMHSVGEPKAPHTHVRYGDIVARLEVFFEEKLAIAEWAGVAREQILIDPGIDFAKQREDNLRIYRELERLHRFGRPILLPVSRKTVIGEVLELPAAAERDAGTIACIVQGLLRGAHIFRVHNVRAAVQSVRVIEAVTAAGNDQGPRPKE